MTRSDGGKVLRIEGLELPIPEAQDLLFSLRRGEVDALVVEQADGAERVFTLEGADRPYRLMIEAMNEAAITFDEQGAILYCNGSFSNLVRLSISEIYASNINSFFDSNNKDSFTKLLEESAHQNVRTELQMLIDGQPVPVCFSISSIHDEDRVFGYCAVISDMREHYSKQVLLGQQQVERARREEAEKARRRILGYLETITDSFFSLDGEFRFTAANDKALSLFARNKEDLIGYEIWTLFPALFESELGKALRTAAQSDAALHFEAAWEIGRGGWVEAHCYPLERGLCVYYRDITERKRAEKDREKLLNELNEAAHKKDQFLAMLAHELRNPLHPIRNAVQILRRLNPPDETIKWARDVIDNQVDQLSRLVDDLLDVSRITQGKVVLQKQLVDLNAVILNAVETAQPLITAREHQLTIDIPDTPIYVQGDPARLSQIVSNLLNNAAKFTNSAGSITLWAGKSGGSAEIRVKDSGMGIPNNLLNRIFELFLQVNDSIDRKEGGLGVGLALVKSLVEMHGGAVSAFSEGPGKGSEFVVSIPLSMKEAPSEAATGSLSHSAEKPQTAAYRILVVDDSLLSALSMVELLRMDGHKVEMAGDASTALELCRSFNPELILLDIGLPEMDGYQVAEQIRKNLGMRDTTIIALTGYGRPEDLARSKEAGFNHHLTKPVHLHMLQSIISNLKSPAK